MYVFHCTDLLQPRYIIVTLEAMHVPAIAHCKVWETLFATAYIYIHPVYMSSYFQVLGHRISLLLLACTALMNDSQVCSFAIQEGHKKAVYGFTSQLLFESWLGHLLRVLTVPTLCK